jgi:hypothetical protein
MTDPSKVDPREDLFGEVEDIEELPSFDEKLDTIIDLLRKNEQEHQEIRDELKEIRGDQKALRAAYQEHGLALGGLMAKLNGFGGGHP